jgi:hypothetical protein
MYVNVCLILRDRSGLTRRGATPTLTTPGALTLRLLDRSVLWWFRARSVSRAPRLKFDTPLPLEETPT